MQFMPIIDAVELIRLEYSELPELRLTFWQAQRLWSFSEELCERALTALITSGFLARTPDGAYIRRNPSPMSVERVASLVSQIPGAIT